MPKGSSKGYSTVRFVTPNAPLGDDDTPRFIEANRMIKDAITDQMAQHGLQVVERNADLLIAYLIVFQDNVSTSYSNQYFGTRNFMELVDLAHRKGTQVNYPEKVLKRMVVIDLIDAQTNKLVYRDYALSGSVAQLSETDRQEHIYSVVEQALLKFFD